MSQGRIAEFATPAELLRDQKSEFYAVRRSTSILCERTLTGL